MIAKKFALLVCVFSLMVAVSANAQDLLPDDNGLWSYHTSPEWRESESHPLRVTAYVFHPIGWISRELIFRPLSYFASSTKFTRSFFGYRYPFDFRKQVCFTDGDQIPDCRDVAPFSQLSMTPPEQVSGDRMTEEMNEAAMVSGERQVFFPDVNFEFNKNVLNDLGRGRVRQIAQLLASIPSVKIVVEGHADNRGTEDYNMALAERRAQAVITELTELGIDPARMSPMTKGETSPIFSEDEDWAFAVNRRVQFSVDGQG